MRPLVDWPGVSPRSLLGHIALLTSVNDHDGARIEAATMFGATSLIEGYQRIQQEHLRLGHLPGHLEEQRRGLDAHLRSVARRKLSAEDYARLKL